MKTGASVVVLVGILSACASLTPEGSRVKVYEADLAAPPASRKLPQGCRFLAATAPVDQMESERHGSDPYRAQRNETGRRGGNVLLVLSSRFVTRYKTDCAPSDTSPDCQNRGQNWYKVSFESYACDGSALQALAAVDSESSARAKPGWWPFGRKKAPTPEAAASHVAAAPTPTPAPASSGSAAASARLAPAALLSKILALMREGVGEDVILAYVRANRLSAPLTAEEILDWKKAGVADDVIRATFPE